MLVILGLCRSGLARMLFAKDPKRPSKLGPTKKGYPDFSVELAFQPRLLAKIKSVPRVARVTFLCGQESNQRRPPGRPVGPATRDRCASRQGISGRHIPVPSGNGAHRARRPSGIRPTCLPGLNGVERQEQERLPSMKSHIEIRIPLFLPFSRRRPKGVQG